MGVSEQARTSRFHECWLTFIYVTISAKELLLASPKYACRRIVLHTIVALSLLAQPCKEGLAVEKSVVRLQHPRNRSLQGTSRARRGHFVSEIQNEAITRTSRRHEVIQLDLGKRSGLRGFASI